MQLSPDELQRDGLEAALMASACTPMTSNAIRPRTHRGGRRGSRSISRCGSCCPTASCVGTTCSASSSSATRTVRTVRLRGSPGRRGAARGRQALASSGDPRGRRPGAPDRRRAAASLLPAALDPDHLEVATYYQPGVAGTQVGGDWYDVIELGAAASRWSSAT